MLLLHLKPTLQLLEESSEAGREWKHSLRKRKPRLNRYNVLEHQHFLHLCSDVPVTHRIVFGASLSHPHIQWWWLLSGVRTGKAWLGTSASIRLGSRSPASTDFLQRLGWEWVEYTCKREQVRTSYFMGHDRLTNRLNDKRRTAK